MNTKTFRTLLFLATLFIGVSACTTNDVAGESIPKDEMYELADAAFAEYLMHNSRLAASEANALPANIVVITNGKYYLNKSLAESVVGVLYLVKDNTRMQNLQAAGVATAFQKIENLDGIQFFVNCTDLKLTSNTLAGKLDLSALSKLEILEMNSNYVNELTVPSSVVRLRYNASSADNAPADRFLTAINLSGNTNLNHLHLPNHRITTQGLQLPTSYSDLTYINLSGNAEAPFVISDALYDQLTTAEGVVKGTTVVTDFAIPDVAFAEYLEYLSNLDAGDSNKLPDNIVRKEGNTFYIDVTIASTVTGTLYLVKDNTRMGNLETAGVATARQKIENLDGIQYFVNCTDLKLTSNTLTGKLDLSALSKLEILEMNSNYVNELIVPPTLLRLRYAASTSSSAPANRFLTAIDLTANKDMNHIHLPNHQLTAGGLRLPSQYAALVYINVSGNTGTPFVIPAALFAQLTTAEGVVSE
ncbi:MAG: hypothetical protein Q4G08_07715 [Capnocytophaga sp.]|nr:hypothetical protein [Capnocytophaga sp.]